MTFRLNNVLFKETFASVPTVAQFAPVFADLRGNFSGSVALNTTLDETMAPVIPTLSSHGFIMTRDLDLSSVAIISRITEAAHIQGDRNLAVRDMRIDYTITNGRMTTSPFDINFGDTSINLSGSTGIDQSIDYSGRVTIPPAMAAAARVGTLPLRITGTFSDPSVSIDTRAVGATVVSNVASEALSAVSRASGVDMADIARQRQVLIDTAQRAGDRLVEEARDQAKELEDRASNPIARAGAKVTGDAMIREAQRQSDEMVAKATEEGDRLYERAAEN